MWPSGIGGKNQTSMADGLLYNGNGVLSGVIGRDGSLFWGEL
jgi:hypothetical protein